MIISPATIQVEKSIASVPKTASQRFQGSSSVTTIAPPHAVYATRSGTPATCKSGMRPSRTSETPSMTGVAVPELVPDSVNARPSRIAIEASTSRRRRRPVGGSGRFRIAVETFITLTRHAEMATTTRVRSIPSAKAMTRLRGVCRELDLQALVLVRRGEGARHHGDHAQGDERSQERADERGQQVVGDPFEGEHLHEMSAPRADRACDAELAPPLGGEHHEDEEDQEDARGDGERPERREERHEGVAGSVGVLDCVRLEGLDLESQLLGHGREERDDLSREASPGDVPSSIRDCDDLDLAVAVEQLLRLVERDEHGCVGRAGTIEPDDIPHARGDRSSAGVDDDSISALDAELPRGLRVEEDLACAADRRATACRRRSRDRREPVHPVGVAREEDDARLALALGRRLDGDLLDDRTGDAVDEAGARRGRLDARNGRLVDPAGAGRRPERTRDVVDCALRRDRLVRRAERCDGRRPDRVAHRVAGRQSGGDDRGAEHQPEHDEGAAPAPAPDAPHGELDEDAVPDAEGCQGAERDAEPDEEDDEERVGGDAEDFLHRLCHQDARRVGERHLVVLPAGRGPEHRHVALELRGREPGGVLGSLLRVPEGDDHPLARRA